MKDLSLEERSPARPASPLAESGGSVQWLAIRIEREVQRLTGGAIHELAVEVGADRIRLTGRCQTFYQKQLAQQVVLTMPGGRQLYNDIRVA